MMEKHKDSFDSSLIGQTIGDFRINQYVGSINHPDGSRRLHFRLKCKAGHTRDYSSTGIRGEITQGKPLPCESCRRRPGGRTSPFEPELIGKTFGDYTIIEYLGLQPTQSGNRRVFYMVQCQCGNKRRYPISDIRFYMKNQKPVSCKSCANARSSRTHGLSGKTHVRTVKGRRQYGYQSQYRLYALMRELARKQQAEVDPRWLGRGGFENFLTDMQPARTRKTTIKRIDKTKCYCKSNCIIVHSRRCEPVYYQHEGSEWTIPELAFAYEINESTLRFRLNNGWSLDDALTIPANSVKPNQIYEYNGKFMRVPSIARAVGLHPSTLYTRLESGQTLQEAIHKPVDERYRNRHHQSVVPASVHEASSQSV
jgi:hypothetical protein